MMISQVVPAPFSFEPRDVNYENMQIFCLSEAAASLLYDKWDNVDKLWLG